MRFIIILMLVFGGQMLYGSSPADTQQDLFLKAMQTELTREFDILKKEEPPVYYLAYRAEETRQEVLEATLGDICTDLSSHERKTAVHVRVGSAQIDNTHELKGETGVDYSAYREPELLPLDNNDRVIQKELWRITQKEFSKAVERYQKVIADETVMAKAEDQSADFTMEKAVVDIKPAGTFSVNKAYWKDIIQKISKVFRTFPDIYTSGVNFNAIHSINYYLDSSGTMLRHSDMYVRLYISASSRSDDGMPIYLHESFSGFTEKEIPDEQTLLTTAQTLAEKIVKLRVAPVVEPYNGPAIFLPKATGVFFHEVMGHRLEGHRQKSEREGQTFTKKLGKEVLPAFIDVVDDPTQQYFQKIPLLGYYLYDDEGVKAQKAVLVDKGILKGFLMSRSPIADFSSSNGHGRSNIGINPVARQANLIITASQTIPYEELKARLIEECKKQNKPYGLVFADISGGFTITERAYLQAFKVIPLEVYRVYTDGRPEELVRGVDIVGTPLAALDKILAASDNYDVFNGFCGAESGYVPVGVAAPGMLVAEIEVEKKEKDMIKPAILASPLSGGDQ